MSFGLIPHDEEAYRAIIDDDSISVEQKLDLFVSKFGAGSFPAHIIKFILEDSGGQTSSVSFHKSSEFGRKARSYTSEEINLIRRKKGVFGTNEYARSPYEFAKHHIKLFYNQNGKARIYYKVRGNSIRFMQNSK